MDSGQLRSRIIIETPKLGSPSASGQRSNSSWSPLLSCYANITALSGTLLDYAKTFSVMIDHAITIRYSTNYNVSRKCRVNYGGRIFTIHAVVDKTNTREWLTILCSEVGA